MAQRRMFSMQIIDTDAFMDLPLTSQALYFHLCMRADDDGFIGNPRRIQKLVGASDDDLKLLVVNRFLLSFDNGVVVVKHWKVSNYIPKDRYKPTLYKDEMSTLFLKSGGVYTDHQAEGATPCIQYVYKTKSQQESGENLELPMVCGGVDILYTQDRLGKDRLGKDRLGKDNNIYSGGGGDARADAEKAVVDYMTTRGIEPGSCFGVTEDIEGQSNLFTDAIFAKFANRAPTAVDKAMVFDAVKVQTWQNETCVWSVSLSKDRLDLLMYAFEQASNAGKPADWNYINGVLTKLHQRGITTLEQAEDYDAEG